MVTAWGGYIFIINLIPLHVLVLLFTGRYSSRLYVAYTTFYALGTILAMQIRFVNFQAVQSSEHMLSLGTFGLLQLYVFVMYVRESVGKEIFASASKTLFAIGLGGLAAAFVVGQATGFIAPWTGRFYSFLDPTYAKEHIPIIASVSEHQPTTWASFFFDLHLLVFLFPVGLYFCFRSLSDANLFVVIYGITSVYFAGVMVRLMLVLAPIACVLSGIAVSEVLKTYSRYIKPRPFGVAKANKSDVTELPLAKEIGYVMVAGTAMLLVLYVFHCTWVTSEAYSSPSIVLAAKQADGSRIIFDDFREAYWWLQMNTPLDTRVMSWWDYGYQLASMANRTTLVDNNTWNNSHIAEVGTAFASTEDVAYGIMRRMDVDYVLVIFGGLTGYASDDINKFLWMVRIGGSTHPNIKEADYYTRNGEFRVDAGGSPVLLNTLMYKLCYYRFGAVYTERGRPPGFDRVRNVEIGNKDFELEHLEEAFTSQHWIVRLYKVKKPNNRLP
jgi:dolichyl-diphosphooligosaccharide--protein glycosyltransferase